MPRMTRLAPASHLLIASLLLFAACGDSGSTEAEEGETGDPTGADTDEPLFFPPGAKLIPAGNVWRGCLPDDGNCDDDENPGGRVDVSAFFIDRFEATARSYGDCINDGVCPEPDDDVDCNFVAGRLDHPMNCLSWDMAKTYCEWRGMRLPTEAEWERAARGTDARAFPWGAEPPTCKHAVMHGCTDFTRSVGSLPAGASPVGALDMAGNVSEWVEDWWAEDGYARQDTLDPTGPSEGEVRAVRGGSFYDGPSTLRTSYRYGIEPLARLNTVGFRCAR